MAWLAELFSDPKQRERVLGYTQAFCSVGGLLVATPTTTAVTHARQPAGDLRRPTRAVALHADVRLHPGDSADHHPAVPARVADLAAEEAGRHAQAAQHAASCSRPRTARTTIVTTIMFACAFGAAFGAIQHMPRIVPGIPEVRGAGAAPRGSRSVSVVQSYQEFGGLLGRDPARDARGAHRVAPGAAVDLPAARVCWSCRSCSSSRPTLAELGQVGHFLRGPVHRVAVQLLGQLSATDVSDLPARHGRELRGQRRRTDDRHVRGLGHAEARDVDVGRRAGTSAGLRGRVGRAAWSTSAASITSFWLPEPKREELPE